MPMPEFIAGYVCGFGSVVFGMILTALLFPNKDKDDGANKDDKESQW